MIYLENNNKELNFILTSRKACARNMMLLSTALTIFARMYFGQTLKATITNIGPIRNLTMSKTTYQLPQANFTHHHPPHIGKN